MIRKPARNCSSRHLRLHRMNFAGGKYFEMNPLKTNKTSLTLLSMISAPLLFSAQAEKRPNIIVIFADDMGWADLGIHGAQSDVKTPNLDQMARDGALCRHGYVTSPQCSPSRAGLMTGIYQQRFGFDTIPDCPLRLEQVTVAERLKEAGYTTGMVGKWHLEPNQTSVKWGREVCPDRVKGGRVTPDEELVLKYFPGAQGFDFYFTGVLNRYRINYDLAGNPVEPQWREVPGYRIEIQTQAAKAFIAGRAKDPFFLYLAYYSPHVPLEATPKYLDRFPGEMPQRRRYALAMNSAMDDGIGEIRRQLADLGLEKNTVLFFMSDNGAPLKIDMEDLPVSVSGGTWNGSMNTPWVGEKGMLMEGGIRVPYVVAWPGTVPSGTVVDEPVISLDMAATVLALAGLPKAEELDGINLLPRLSGKSGALPERDLFWRFWQQGAILRGSWKYMVLTDGREMLYDLSTDLHEKQNLIGEFPEKTDQLRRAWREWSETLQPPGFRSVPLLIPERKWYDHYLNLRETSAPSAAGPAGFVRE